MNCPRPSKHPCSSKKFTLLSRKKDDTIDKLDHSHMRCDKCGFEFNHWNESEARLKEIFGGSYETYK